MRTILSLLLLLISVSFSYGQKALTFNEAKEQGLSSARLDSLYASGVSFHPDQLTAAQEKRFGELLAGFILEYRFQLSADKNFSQCSNVTYMPIGK